MSAVSVTRVRYAPRYQQARHTDDRVQISVVLRGTLRERVGRLEERAGPLSVVVKARGVEHADTYGTGGVLIGSLALEGDEGERLLEIGRPLPSWLWSPASPALRPMLRLVDRLQTPRHAMDPDDPDVLDVLAAVTCGGRDRSRVPPSWLMRVRERFDDGDHVSVRLAAVDAGVHPVYLARAFRRWFGCSISTYLQGRRISRSASLLDAGTTITHAACAAGFTDHPHLCHRFKEATGLTPGRYRQVVAPARPAIDVPARRPAA